MEGVHKEIIIGENLQEEEQVPEGDKEDSFHGNEIMEDQEEQEKQKEKEKGGCVQEQQQEQQEGEQQEEQSEGNETSEQLLTCEIDKSEEVPETQNEEQGQIETVDVLQSSLDRARIMELKLKLAAPISPKPLYEL